VGRGQTQNAQSLEVKTVKVKFDRQGRMKYNPDYHPNHGKPFTTDELIYICKFNEVDGARSLSLALGRTEMTIANKIFELKRYGLYEYYRSLTFEKWEKILGRSKGYER